MGKLIPATTFWWICTSKVKIHYSLSVLCKLKFVNGETHILPLGPPQQKCFVLLVPASDSRPGIPKLCWGEQRRKWSTGLIDKRDFRTTTGCKTFRKMTCCPVKYSLNLFIDHVILTDNLNVWIYYKYRAVTKTTKTVLCFTSSW